MYLSPNWSLGEADTGSLKIDIFSTTSLAATYVSGERDDTQPMNLCFNEMPDLREVHVSSCAKSDLCEIRQFRADKTKQTWWSIYINLMLCMQGASLSGFHQRDGGTVYLSLIRVFRRIMIYWRHTWWRHQIETFSELLALSEGNPPGTGGFPSQKNSGP